MDSLKKHIALFEDVDPELGKIYQFMQNIISWAKQKDPTIAATIKSSLRVWTRGDGTRYKDPAALEFVYTKDCDKVWAMLLTLNGAKQIQVSQEFPSQAARPAITWKKRLFIKGTNQIGVGTVSRINNPNAVWKKK